MSVIFEWNESEMKSLLATCHDDDVWPLIQQNLPLESRLLEAGCGAGRWVRFLSDAGYQIRDQFAVHFITFSVVEWINVFYKSIVCSALASVPLVILLISLWLFLPIFISKRNSFYP